VRFPYKIDIRKYRSIADQCEIPFGSKSTFIVGQNNAGKSNVLRALAAIFNKSWQAGDDNPSYWFYFTKEQAVSISAGKRMLSIS
jgi:predicted ATP-dependent endonuclease of OLD family